MLDSMIFLSIEGISDWFEVDAKRVNSYLVALQKPIYALIIILPHPKPVIRL